MKISLFTVMLPDLTPEEAVPLIAAAGYDGIEWRVTTVPPERQHEEPSFWGNNVCTLAPTEADAQRGGELARAHGLDLPTLGTYINLWDLDGVEAAMQFARRAGASCIRVGVGRTGTAAFADLFRQTRAFLTEVEQLAQNYNVKALVETHHETIAASASATFRLLEGRDPRWMGVIYDPGNMVKEGYEDYRNGVELLGDYLAHVHVKNAAYHRPNADGVWQSHWSPMEDGVVDFGQLFAVLVAAGYDGWIGIEDFSAARPSREAIPYNIQFIREQIAQASASR